MKTNQSHDDEDMCEDVYKRLQSQRKNELNKTIDEETNEIP
jgi:hypothetical protein